MLQINITGWTYCYIVSYIINSEFPPCCRYEDSLSTDVSWQQSGGSWHCMPPGRIPSDLGDTTEDEEVQRDPRASSTLLLEEAQVGYVLSVPPTLTDSYNIILI